jgi:methylthioribose-1-phosphate isomerase
MSTRVIHPLEWRGDSIGILDQRLLPHREETLDCRTASEVCDAIRSLAIRGAPILGVTAAYAMALASATSSALGTRGLLRDLERAGRALKATRPTAVNIAWAVDGMLELARSACCSAGSTRERVHEALVAEAVRIEAEDRAACEAMGEAGAALVPEEANVLTHCNTGSLCTAGIGTAQGVIVAAHRAGKRVHVWVDETRPVLQGARLTAWELGRLGIPRTLVSDNATGSLMAAGRVDLVIVGADRIAANGDAANKIGTYSLAVLAHHHGVPFYVAAPTSTIDLGTPSGEAIEIEERDPSEVTAPQGFQIAEVGTPAANPAFDVTPASLITAIVTELGVIRRPSAAALRRALHGRRSA